jgi:hypothetical protein
MLTIQSNLKIHNLETLSKVIIKADIINFGLNKVGGGFTDMIADKIIAKLTLSKDKTIVIINDITLQMTEKLLEAGYTNIYLAFGKWNKDGTVSSDTTVYNIMKAFVKHNIKEDLNVISLKEIFNMKIDGFIVNPPYGSIGANITKNIIDRVDFEEFINLLPLKDYTLETGKYIDFTSISTFPPHSFSDADILTHAVRILNTANKEIKTESDLCAAAFTVDRPMLKFMKANMLKTHYAIDNIKSYKLTMTTVNTFLYSMVAIHSQHTCGLESLISDTVSNAFNFKNEVRPTIVTKAGNSNYKAIQFNTQEERTNFVNFYKENRNFINRMIVNQFIGIRDDAACFPKVDWTKSDWTVETILKEVANYTEEEIKEVLDTMDKDYAVKSDDCIKRLFGEWL